MRRRAAFTLVELVVSVSLMCVILAAAYACLHAGLLTRKMVESRADVMQRGRVAMNLLSADLRAACPLSKEFEFLGLDRTLGEVEADNMDFATHNYKPTRAQEGDFCETSYFLDQDENDGDLILWRRRDPSPDEAPLSGGVREEIARGVRSLRFEYYDGLSWFDEWGDPEGRHAGQHTEFEASNLSGMPEAVRITLVMAPTQRPGASKSPGTKKKKEEEPPLMLQTVARLNLTPISTLSISPVGGGQGGTP